MGRIVGAAVVPTAPLVVPAVAPSVPEEHAEDVVSLRAVASEAIARLPATDAVVLIACGRRSVHATAHLDLDPLGMPEVRRQHPVAETLLADLTSRTQFPQRHGDDLEVDLAVLALQLPESTTVLPIAIPSADGSSLAAVGRAVLSTVRDGGLDVSLLFAGDLSTARDASSPRYLVEGATDWDAATVVAVRGMDVDRLVAQGPEADRVHARSWAPMVVGLAASRAAGLQPRDLRHLAVRGVGHVVGMFGR